MPVLNAQKSTVKVNGAELYYERRGSGPSVLFIPGATGDAGHFERVAEALADEFTTVVYDRRGNSRSPRPEGWTETSTEEQADDAAGLIQALDLAPATIFGTSSGAVIAVNLMVRYPDLVRGAIVHEPALIGVLPDPQAVMAETQAIIESGMATGGPRGACEAFVRMVAGDPVIGSLPADLRERILNNGETLFQIEFGRIEAYQPGAEEISSINCPVAVLAGTESPPFLVETARWLAAECDVPLGTLDGGHAPYLDRPVETANGIRPLIKQMH